MLSKEPVIVFLCSWDNALFPNCAHKYFIYQQFLIIPIYFVGAELLIFGLRFLRLEKYSDCRMA